MKTSELSGAALNWAVAKCEGANWEDGLLVWYGEESVKRQCRPNAYSTDWLQGGPIIEREGIVVDIRKEYGWIAAREFWYLEDKADHDLCSTGETYLIAAMRCYVASKLGDEIEAPKELTI
jgi:hypothetical protein